MLVRDRMSKDLVTVSPSTPVIARLPVEQAMTRKVVTVSPDATLEEAALLMRQHRVGGLPVVEDGRPVGIITETDIFEAFLDLMGLRQRGFLPAPRR